MSEENYCDKLERLSLSGPFSVNEALHGYEFETPEMGVDYDAMVANEAADKAFAEFEDLINFDKKEEKEVGNEIPFDELRRSMVNVTEDGKITKKILKAGVQQVITPKTTASVHYNFYLDHHKLPFDSTTSRSDHPYRFKLGDAAGVFEGFELAVSTMKKREKSQFLIDCTYAFGEMGVPPRVPPNSTILAEIELVNFTEEVDITRFEQTDGFSKKVNFADIYRMAVRHTTDASVKFSNTNYLGAVSSYKKAERLLLTCRLHSDEEEEKQSSLLLKIYVNLMVCYSGSKLNKPEKVCIFARDAFQSYPTKANKNAKLFYLLGMAKASFMDWKSANINLNKALMIDPNNEEILAGIEDVKKRIKKLNASNNISFFEPASVGNPLPNIVNPEDLEGVPADQDFKKCFEDVLKQFMSGPKNQFNLPSGLTSCEKEFCTDLMKQYNLTLCDDTNGGIYAVKGNKKYY